MTAIRSTRGVVLWMVAALFIPGAPAGAAFGAVPPPDALPRVLELTRLGYYAEAESLVRNVLQDRERTFGEASSRTLEALDAYVEVAAKIDRGGPAEARGRAERAVAMHRRRGGEPLAAALARLARILVRQSKLDSAQTVLDEVRAIRTRSLGPRHPLHAGTLLEQCTIDFHRRDGDAQIEHARQAVAFLRDAEAPDSQQVGRAYAVLGRSLLFERSLEAEQWLEEASGILERQPVVQHGELAGNVNNLAVVARDRGDHARARSRFERALALFAAVHGEESEAVALVCDNLAWVRNAMGDHVGARQAAQRSFEIRERMFGPENPRTISSLLKLSDVLRTIGDIEQARRGAERALDVHRRSPGKDSLDLASAASSMAQVLLELGAIREARAHFEEALRLRARVQPPDNVNVLWLRARVAQTHVAAGDFASAIPLLEEVAKGQELGPHQFLSQTLEQLAIAHHALGHLDEARRLHTRQHAICDSVLGPGSRRTLEALADLARVEFEQGRRDAAHAKALQVEAGARRQLRLMAGALAESEALSYAKAQTGGLDLLLTLAASPGTAPASRRSAWDALIRSRSLVFDELADRRRALHVEDPAIARLVATLDSTRTELAGRVVAAAARGAPTDFLRREIEQALLRREAAERALNERSESFRRERATEEIGLGEVMAALPPDAALVGFARYRSVAIGGAAALPGSHDRHAYLAWVWASRGEPTAVPLGSAATIDSLIALWRGALMSPPRAAADRAGAELACTRTGRALRRAIWDPLLPHLGRGGRVFVVIDGDLQLVNFAALPDARGSYLAESGPWVHPLATERDLAAFQEPPRRGSGVLAVGGPDFDSIDDPHDRRTSDEPPVALAAGMRSPLPRWHFDPLVGATEEAVEVARLWRETPGLEHDDASSLSLTGEEATEAAFKRLAPGRQVLHLATHTFRLNGDSPAGLPGSRGVGGLRPNVQPAGPSRGISLTQVGLALAGANRPHADRSSSEDGFLTGEEILSIDLSGVQWAVLSACESGVAADELAEGVRGLHRAFRTAGVSTVVMSLWPVEDQMTQEWMSSLYRARLVQRLSTDRALREATLRMLRERRARRESTHPFFWASFVAAGDWR